MTEDALRPATRSGGVTALASDEPTDPVTAPELAAPPVGEEGPPREEPADTAAATDAAEPDPPAVAEEPQPADPEPVPRGESDLLAFPALADALRIGDVGRQEEIVPVPGPLSIGVSDTELDFFTADPFEVRGCSTRGASHRHAGVPRQDAFCLAADDDWLAVCVADGVSQGKFSQVAAETAARAACKLALDGAADLAAMDWTALANRISKRILDEARYRRLVDLSAVDDQAEQIRTVRRAMATTAVLALVGRRPRADGAFPVVSVVLAGDSGAFVLHEGRFTVLAGGKDVDAEGITDSSVHPLPGPAQPVAVETALAAGDALLLTSDGLGDPIGDGGSDVGLELAGRWHRPPTPARFFTDVNFLRRSYDDDRTAVGVWVLPERADI